MFFLPSVIHMNVHKIRFRYVTFYSIDNLLLQIEHRIFYYLSIF
jgi:hypothetical protein